MLRMMSTATMPKRNWLRRKLREYSLLFLLLLLLFAILLPLISFSTPHYTKRIIPSWP